MEEASCPDALNGLTPIIALPVGVLAANCYILQDPAAQELVLIDPGDEPNRILASLPPGTHLAYIVITHAHFDHLGALARIKEETDAPILVHPADRPLLQSAVAAAELFTGRPIPTPPSPDGDLLPGAVLRVGSLTLEVRHTPGHSPGSCSLLLRRSPTRSAGPAEAVFTGDTLFAGSIGRSDLPGGNPQELLHSIRSQLLTLPDATPVYPGHGPATTIGHERRYNLFLTEES